MPSHLTRPAQIQRAAALLVAEEYLLHYGTTMNVEIQDGHTEVAVHGVEPGELTEACHRWPHAESHRDSDGILRWVEATLHGIEVTLYRR